MKGFYTTLPIISRKYPKYNHNDILILTEVANRSFLPQGDSRSILTISQKINRSPHTVEKSFRRLRNNKLISLKTMEWNVYRKNGTRHARRIVTHNKKTFLVSNKIIEDVTNKKLSSALFELYIFVKQQAYARIELKKFYSKLPHNNRYLKQLLTAASKLGLLKQKGHYIYAALSYFYFRTLIRNYATEPSSISYNVAFGNILQQIIQNVAHSQLSEAKNNLEHFLAVTPLEDLPTISLPIHSKTLKLPKILILLAEAYKQWLQFRYSITNFNYTGFALLYLKTAMEYTVRINWDKIKADFVIYFIQMLERTLRRSKYWLNSDKRLAVFKAYRLQLQHIIINYLRDHRTLVIHDPVEDYLANAPIINDNPVIEEKQYQTRNTHTHIYSMEQVRAKVAGLTTDNDNSKECNSTDNDNSKDELDKLLEQQLSDTFNIKSLKSKLLA